MCADEKQRGAIPENTAVNTAKYGEPNFCLTAASIQSIVRIDERKKNGKSKDLPFLHRPTEIRTRNQLLKRQLLYR